MSGDIGFKEDVVRYAVGKLDRASEDLAAARKVAGFIPLSGVSVPATEAFHRALTDATAKAERVLSFSQVQLGDGAVQVQATVNELADVDASIAEGLAALNERAANVVLPASDVLVVPSPDPSPAPPATSTAGVPPKGAQW